MFTLRQGFQQLPGEVVDGARRGRAEVELPGAGARQRNEILHRFHRQRRVDDEHVDPAGCQRHGSEVPVRVVGYLLAHEREEPQRIAVEQHRVAVGRRFRDHVARDDAAAAVLHDDLLAERCRQPLRDEPRDEVAAAAGLGRHDAHGFGREVLRTRTCRRKEDARSCKAQHALRDRDRPVSRLHHLSWIPASRMTLPILTTSSLINGRQLRGRAAHGLEAHVRQALLRVGPL